MALAAGAFVAVPLGGRLLAGVLWDDAGADEQVPEARLRPLAAALPVPPLPAAVRRFVERVAAYTVTPPGNVLRMSMSVSAALVEPAVRLGYRLAGSPPERLTPPRRRVLEILADGLARTAAELTERAGVGSGVLRGLLAAGTLEEVALPDLLPFADPDPARAGPLLSPGQRLAADALSAAVDQGFSVTLLDGVTGSGKTEVYLEAVAAALAAGRQVLVLLPEIALTADWLTRFERRFGVPPAQWHSELRPGERRRTWRAIADGRARAVVGARSALFLPFPELGLIVVDEEHDQAFKQEEGTIYQARDMAVLRASIGAHPIVLSSATPSLESLNNVALGRYRRQHLPERAGTAVLPAVAAIDLRREPPPRGRWLSPRLKTAVEEVLAAGEQALLFLNRRGYAPLTLCRACGHRLQCPNCTAWLVEHRFQGRLACHHCGFETLPPAQCPACGAEGRFAACGPGVERLWEEVRHGFPDARAEVVASDTVHGPAAAAELVRRIAEREIDLVIGTQMVAKGHHFPHLTLVGVVDADLGLAGGDLRATERTWQLLHQVSGRAGRAERAGRVLLQTWQPEHPVMRALVSGDRDGFLEREAEARRAAGMPPFGRLVALIVSAADPAQAQETARALARRAPAGAGIAVLGPAPAPLALLRGRHRWRLLLRTPRGVNASELARQWVAAVPAPGSVRIAVDVDPYSFL